MSALAVNASEISPAAQKKPERKHHKRRSRHEHHEGEKADHRRFEHGDPGRAKNNERAADRQKTATKHERGDAAPAEFGVCVSGGVHRLAHRHHRVCAIFSGASSFPSSLSAASRLSSLCTANVSQPLVRFKTSSRCPISSPSHS